MSKEPEILRLGKAFHRRVQEDWERTARDGHVTAEKTISLRCGRGNLRHHRKGRMDLLIDELGDFVSIVEIKGTDWDRVLPHNRKRLMAAHKRQV